MSLELAICLVALVLWTLTVIQGSCALWQGVRFHRYVSERVDRAPDLADESGRFKYQPKAAVVLPCCGIDDELRQTVQALQCQNYADYEVIFTFESEEDPAYAAVGEWIDDWASLPHRRVVAGLTEGRSQKVHNLLAAVEEVSPDREVFAFLDSDAVPGEDWLGHMVAPLEDETVGATTGYRWYSARGGFAEGLRCNWNAATVTLLSDEKLNFSWGGATAILRKTFEAFEISKHWSTSLTDDYPITLAARRAGKIIRFVPQALIPSEDSTTLRDFWVFARRQLIITRVYVPEIWRAGFTLCLNFVVGGTAAAALFFASLLGWVGGPAVTIAAFAGWMLVLALASGKALVRQLAIRKVLRPPAWTWLDFWWDVGGVSLTGLLHLALLVSSGVSRRFTWRKTLYELISPTETRVLRRGGTAGD
ncbi:MAG: glycosyltransferase [Planctomycetota bacterium]